MSAVVSAVIAVARFIYDFIFGDDWRVAVVIVLGLFITAWLVSNGLPAWWLVPILAIVMTLSLIHI